MKDELANPPIGGSGIHLSVAVGTVTAGLATFCRRKQCPTRLGLGKIPTWR
jgi:hypothetical protein